MKHLFLFLLMASSSAAQIIGSAQNLAIFCTGNAAVTATATYCDVHSASSTTGLANVSVTGNITASGANGLDTGSVTASTWYATLIISHADGTSPAMLFTTSPTSPTMPSGYTLARHVDWERTDASSHLIKHLTTGRHHSWSWSVDSSNVSCAVINASTAATFTQVSATAVAPPTSQILYGVLSTSNADPVYVRATGYGSGSTIPSTGMAILLALSASYYSPVWVPMSSGQQFDYIDGGHATSLFVSGFDTGL